MRASQLDLDMKLLFAQPAFRRFLLQLSRDAGIWLPTAGATDAALHQREGRRSLGLDIIRQAARGLPRGTTTEQVLALVLSEATPQETQDDPSEQYESERS